MEQSQKNLVGHLIRQKRISLKLSQEELAARCNVLGWDISRGTLSKIEAEIRRVNDAELFIISKSLNLTPNDLLKVSLQSALVVARHGNLE